MSDISRPVLRYFGGKFLLAPWIISHMPAHRVYVEPFGGAASVLMQKPRSYAEVYNDMDSEVVTLFRVLRDREQAAALERSLRLTPFAREEFNLAYQETNEPIEIARRLLVRAYMGFGSNAHNSSERTGFRANSHRSGTTGATDWENYPDCLRSFCERLAGVVIENRDACEVMLQQDSPQTLHFVDPPYIHDTRGVTTAYRFEMSDDQHIALCDILKGLKGMVMLCGYEHPLYERLGWLRINRAAHADGAKDRIECLWLNPAAERATPQASLFGGAP